MTIAGGSQISFEQAQALVTMLESGDQQGADEMIMSLQNPLNSELFAEIGKLTRQLHESLKNFQLDSKLSNLATEDIPDAKERLNYVISRTEDAANKTMDAVETVLPMVDKIQGQVQGVLPGWQKLMNRQLELGEFKELCLSLDTLLKDTEAESGHINMLMTDVLMAQDFQDLTGQVLSKVIELVRDVEDNLINLLTAFGVTEDEMKASAEKQKEEKVVESIAEGPIIDAEEREDVVSGQDDVDDLLSSLGF